MSGLKNSDLEKLLKNIIGKNFLGVYPSDIAPKSKQENFCMVFNLSPHDQPGSHFVGVIKFKNKIIYFDPFGEECNEKHILNFLHLFNLQIETNRWKIQNELSIFCGIFCTLFLCVCFKDRKPLSYLQQLFPNEGLKTNDNDAVTFILKSLNK